MLFFKQTMGIDLGGKCALMKTPQSETYLIEIVAIFKIFWYSVFNKGEIMLQMLQLVNFMLNRGYRLAVIERELKRLQTSQDVADLYNTLGLETPSDLQTAMLLQKVGSGRVDSAIRTIKMMRAA